MKDQPKTTLYKIKCKVKLKDCAQMREDNPDFLSRKLGQEFEDAD